MTIETSKSDEIQQLKIANNPQIWQSKQSNLMESTNMTIETSKSDDIKQLKIANIAIKTSKSDGIAFFIITGVIIFKCCK